MGKSFHIERVVAGWARDSINEVTRSPLALLFEGAGTAGSLVLTGVQTTLITAPDLALAKGLERVPITADSGM